MKRLIFILIISGIFAIPVLAIDYKQDVLPIMKERCFDCHAGADSKGNLDLEDLEKMRDYQVGKFNIIRPGNPEESSFLEKMNLPEGDSDFMPRKGTRLPQKELDTITSWIKAGAVIDSKNPGEKEQEWVKKSPSPVGGGAAKPSQDFISWKSSDGKTIEARFMGLQGEAAKLVMKNGKSYVVPFERLSPESIATAREMAAAK
jgi:Planctomycete cytochrome C